MEAPKKAKKPLMTMQALRSLDTENLLGDIPDEGHFEHMKNNGLAPRGFRTLSKDIQLLPPHRQRDIFD